MAMDFKFLMSTDIIFGRGCIYKNKSELRKYGTRAFIVTGNNSAKKSGALDDVIITLKENGSEFAIFDKVENNPSIESVVSGAKEAAIFNADYIIGIGGGSPLDAAKAIAVLAVNDMEPSELFKNSFPNKPLPVIAIPTTAGTGSEVTQYSILTRKDMSTKMGFGNEHTFPKLAFMDARYTETLSSEVTVNTAIDALSHAVEGYLSKRSTTISDAFALEAIGIFGRCIDSLRKDTFDYETREQLLYMAMLGGIVIAQTGTTIIHGMGYSLTYFKEVPHGKANGILMREYFKYNYKEAKEKTDKLLNLLNLNSIDEFGETIERLLNIEKFILNVSEQEIMEYASLTMKQKSTSYNIRDVKEEELVELFKKSLNKA